MCKIGASEIPEVVQVDDSGGQGGKNVGGKSKKRRGQSASFKCKSNDDVLGQQVDLLLCQI